MLHRMALAQVMHLLRKAGRIGPWSALGDYQFEGLRLGSHRVYKAGSI